MLIKSFLTGNPIRDGAYTGIRIICLTIPNFLRTNSESSERLLSSASFEAYDKPKRKIKEGKEFETPELQDQMISLKRFQFYKIIQKSFEIVIMPRLFGIFEIVGNYLQLLEIISRRWMPVGKVLGNLMPSSPCRGIHDEKILAEDAPD